MRVKRFFFMLAAILVASLPVLADESTKPVWQQANPTAANYLSNRRALVGRGCEVNKLVNTVGVASWASHLEALTDEDLTNTATFPNVVDIDAIVGPVTSVRDMNNHYAANTEAGFIISGASGTSVLQLDIIKAYAISFYLEGKLQETIAVTSGQDAGTLNLTLISIPGSNDVDIELGATSTKEFDEVALMPAGGVNADVANEISIKYAYVGKISRDYLTTTGLASYSEKVGRPTMTPDVSSLVTTLVVPTTLQTTEEAKVIDDNFSNGATWTPILSIGLQGQVGVAAVHNSKDTDNSCAFKAGSKVGVEYTFANVLDLSVGTWAEIKLYKCTTLLGVRQYNEVQTATINANVVGLGVAGGVRKLSFITATEDFDKVEIGFYTVLEATVGAITVHDMFIQNDPEAQHECDLRLSGDVNICCEQSDGTYTLNWDKTKTVTNWAVINQPSGANATVANGVVSNMTIPGDYVIQATAADGCTATTTIHYGLNYNATYNEPILKNDGNETLFELSTAYTSEGGIDVGSMKLDDPENILNSTFDDYAQYRDPEIAALLTSSLIFATTWRRVKISKLAYDFG